MVNTTLIKIIIIFYKYIFKFLQQEEALASELKDRVRGGTAMSSERNKNNSPCVETSGHVEEIFVLCRLNSLV